MKKGLYLLLVAISFVLIAAGCGTDTANTTPEASGSASEEKIELTHKLGDVAISKNPKNVVVFDFGILDSLDKMGVEVSGVPQTNIPSYLSKYEDSKYENVGSLKEPDFEKISELSPDLIIISARQAEMYEEFTEIAPTLYVEIDYANYMDSFKGNMNTLAQIFEKEELVEEELAAIDEKITAVNEKVSATEATGLIVLANEGNISAYGPSSRFGIIHDVFGLKAADENIEVSTHGQNVSFEYIAEENPDYLFVIDRNAAVGGQTSGQELIENDLVKNTNAYKNDQIVYLSPDYWYLSGGGLVSVVEMVNEIEGSIK